MLHVVAVVDENDSCCVGHDIVVVEELEWLKRIAAYYLYVCVLVLAVQVVEAVRKLKSEEGLLVSVVEYIGNILYYFSIGVHTT